MPGIPENNILAEPCPRNTKTLPHSVCLLENKKKYPDANIVVTPSDQVVIDTTEFLIIDKALSFTDKSSAIITLGINPASETGYGYIAAGEPIARDKEIFHESFRENPIKRHSRKISDGR